MTIQTFLSFTLLAWAPIPSVGVIPSCLRVSVLRIPELDLPALQSLTLGIYAFDGDFQSNRKGIPMEPFNWKNTLTMKSGNGGVG